MSQVFSYQTIAQPVESELKEKGSKFFGFAFPVADENEIKSYLNHLKEIHPKATHHCYAWRLGTDENLFRVQDDGEPSGTAGKPILGQIDRFGLTNCLVVSVRYFGGTKLGVSGLISAYKTNAGETLEQADIVVKEFYKKAFIECEYDTINLAYQWIHQYGGNILEQNMTESCRFTVEIPLRTTENALNEINQYYPLQIEIE